MRYPVPVKINVAAKIIREKFFDNLPVILDEIYDELQEEYNESYKDEYESNRENGDSAAEAKENALDTLKSQFLTEVVDKFLERMTGELENCLEEHCEA